MKTAQQLIGLILMGACAVSSVVAQDYKFKAGYPTSAAISRK